MPGRIIKKINELKKTIPTKKKSTIVVYAVLRIFVIAEIVLGTIRGDYSIVFYSVLTLILMLLPDIAERSFKIDLPDTLEIIILSFIFAAEILGEINSFYVRVPHWDTMLHTINGFLCAAIGLSLVDLFNRSDRFSLKLSPKFLAIVAFCFSMTVGAMWELIEFSGDMFLGMDMQKDTVVPYIHSVELDPTKNNIVMKIEDITDVIVVHGDGSTESLGLGGYLDVGIRDTMKDLFVNFIGAVIFVIIGYFYIKARGKRGFVEQFIPVITEPELVSDEVKNVSDGEDKN